MGEKRLTIVFYNRLQALLARSVKTKTKAVLQMRNSAYNPEVMNEIST